MCVLLKWLIYNAPPPPLQATQSGSIVRADLFLCTNTTSPHFLRCLLLDSRSLLRSAERMEEFNDDDNVYSLFPHKHGVLDKPVLFLLILSRLQLKRVSMQV